MGSEGKWSRLPAGHTHDQQDHEDHDKEKEEDFGDRGSAFNGLSDHMPLIARFRLQSAQAIALSEKPAETPPVSDQNATG